MVYMISFYFNNVSFFNPIQIKTKTKYRILWNYITSNICRSNNTKSLWWALRKLVVARPFHRHQVVQTIQAMYANPRSNVWFIKMYSNNFEIKFCSSGFSFESTVIHHFDGSLGGRFPLFLFLDWATIKDIIHSEMFSFDTKKNFQICFLNFH